MKEDCKALVPCIHLGADTADAKTDAKTACSMIGKNYSLIMGSQGGWCKCTKVES